MKSEYHPDELLALSGIQHFCFCRRQWALIYIERQWQDNVLTAEGKLLHERVDDPFFKEVRGGVVIARAVSVASYKLGLYGVCDLVEFSPSDKGVSLPGRRGIFMPAPVEYKHGEEKRDHSDEVQLCAQAICLEEMLSVVIPRGYFYYARIHKRQEMVFSDELRLLVEQQAKEMHAYFSRGYTPKVKTSKACRSCSLQDICLPELQSEDISASQYIKREIEA